MDDTIIKEEVLMELPYIFYTGTELVIGDIIINNKPIANMIYDTIINVEKTSIDNIRDAGEYLLNRWAVDNNSELTYLKDRAKQVSELLMYREILKCAKTKLQRF